MGRGCPVVRCYFFTSVFIDGREMIWGGEGLFWCYADGGAVNKTSSGLR